MVRDHGAPYNPLPQSDFIAVLSSSLSCEAHWASFTCGPPAWHPDTIPHMVRDQSAPYYQIHHVDYHTRVYRLPCMVPGVHIFLDSIAAKT